MATNKVKRTAEFMINVSLGESNDFQGYLEFLPSGETTRFNSVMDMMTLMQAKLNEYGVPQSTTILRSWNEEPNQRK